MITGLLGTYDMLGVFTFTKTDIDSDDFQILFDIPINCDAHIEEIGGEFIIGIALKPGEVEPSKVFVPKSEDARAIGGILSVTFEQHKHNGTIHRKPKVEIGL